MLNSACIVSIVRLAFVGRLDSSSDPSCKSTVLQKSHCCCHSPIFIRVINADMVRTGDDIPTGVLSTVEICVGIIAVCIATWRPLFNRLLRRSTVPIDTSRNLAGKPRGDQVSQIELTTQMSSGSEDQQRLYMRIPEQGPPV